MFSKPLSLALVYILTIFNFMVLMLPFLIAFFPFINIKGNEIVLMNYLSFNPKLAVLMLICVISFLMLFYLVLDFLFGFSVASSLKKCKRYEKDKNYLFLEEIFNQAKFKFNSPKAKLYIKDSDEINAFAVAGIRKKAVVLSRGLIDHFADNTENEQQFIIALRSIIGHEMSHLINKDFLPGLLILINQKVTNFVAGIFLLVFSLAIKIFSYLRLRNIVIANFITSLYNISNWVLSAFNRYVVYGVYEFTRRLLSRSIEYRCDRQSAKAFGGINMAFALSLFGKSSYFTMFSTHPATQRRIKKVEIVEEKNAIIVPSIFNSISNFISILVLPTICFYTAHLSKLDLIMSYYIYNNYPEFYNNALWFIEIIINL